MKKALYDLWLAVKASIRYRFRRKPRPVHMPSFSE